MNVFYSLQKRKPQDRKKTFLTVGNFDGLHLGHQALIKKMVAEAKRASAHSAVITFVNHPAQVIRPQHCPLRITPNAQRIRLFEALGVDELYMLEFSTEFSGQTTVDFLNHLSESLHINKILMGHDAAIGKNREGDFAHMVRLGEKLHFTVEEFPAVAEDGKIVSSTLIRKAIAEGNLGAASHLLGRAYSIEGKVVPGEGNGKQIGFPTANIDVSGLCVPPVGVYGVSVRIDGEGKLHKGIANLGCAPTVKNFASLLLEVHLFDWNKSLYYQTIEVIFERFLRPEMKFPSVEALVEQIKKDIHDLK
jgi:riboflavin kinase/FMN adenylyltransferase